MHAFPIPVLPPPSVVRPRTVTRSRSVLVASADRSFRQRLVQILSGLRWLVLEAESGARAWEEVEARPLDAIIVDAWLPDLDMSEFLGDLRKSFPGLELVTTGGVDESEGPRGPHRQELLYALHQSQETDTAAWNAASEPGPLNASGLPPKKAPCPEMLLPGPATRVAPPVSMFPRSGLSAEGVTEIRIEQKNREPDAGSSERLPELVGDAPCMLEISRRIRLVAPRMTPVLIEGPTGSGKELVAEALHRLSSRHRKPFIAINCAAIPEALLEAELFGHTRGAFTGAVQSRTGRIEAADGGSLFLD